MMMRPIPWMLAASLLLAATGCREASDRYEPRDNTEEREAFYERYNRETLDKLRSEKEELEAELDGELDEEEREDAEQRLADLEERLEQPKFFEFREEADLPDDLEWETGMDQPEIGSSEAEKGGVQHSFIPGGSYPPTIRSVGKEANNSFRSFHWDDVEMALAGLHPDTGEVIPGLADRWAVGEDGRSVYFHIDDEAKWSDGKEVVAGDWVMSFYVYLSDYLSVAFYRNYYGEQFWGITTYGDDYLCIRLAYPKPLAPFFASVVPFQEDFYGEFGPDFEERYNWRPRPTTGAYEIREEDIKKGNSIALTRVKDWWARDRKYYKNRFNVDRVEYRLVRDDEKIFQMFLLGDIDIVGRVLMNDPQLWYERTEVEEVFDGYIHKATFYNEYPRPPRGLYFNLSKSPLDDLDVRIGLCHATNWEKVIRADLRGDASRLNVLGAGFLGISPEDIRAREFSVRKARAAFARAGYTETDDDGYLINDEGRRLSLTLTHAKDPVVEKMLRRLKEEAARAGVEYKLEGLDPTTFFQRVMRKEHEITFFAWSSTPPFPDYYQQFHSKEAYLEGTKEPRPMTNNISIFGDPEVDPILEANRNARSLEVVRETSRELEEIFHDRAVWVPGYKRTYYRLAYWRWVRWPEDFNVRIADESHIAHVHWIDSERKEETLEAIREGRTFEERNLVFDKYRAERERVEETAPEDGEGPRESTRAPDEARDAAPDQAENEPAESAPVPDEAPDAEPAGTPGESGGSETEAGEGDDPADEQSFEEPADEEEPVDEEAPVGGEEAADE